MIYIKKQPTPAKILHAAQRMRNSDRWKAIPDDDTAAIRSCFEDLEYYDDNQRQYVYAKGLIRAELLKEQHYLCAYCMQPIKDDGSATKVEHYLPLSGDKEKALDYQNFLAVCKGGEKPKRDWPVDENGIRIAPLLCCEAVKGDETKLTIDPRNQEMMEHVTYHSNGILNFEGLSDYTEDDVKAIKTDINQHLRLNGEIKEHPDGEIEVTKDTATRLVYHRRSTYQGVDNTLQRLRRSGKLSLAEVDKRIHDILCADKMEEFAGVKLFLLQRERNRLSKQIE